MNFRWNVFPPRPLLAHRLASDLRISPLLAQCLVNRGLTESRATENFLAPRLKQLADPFLLPNMDRAVARLLHAREAGQALVIFGDYDVDGVTSTALLLEVFRSVGIRAHSYLPHRMDEGYGLTREAVENCLARFPSNLLLAVDCGSTARETISWLRGQGIDVIVLDHHQVSNPPPPATALVNPQLRKWENTSATPEQKVRNTVAKADEASATSSLHETDSGGEFIELCSVGLAFKLAHALIKRGREIGIEEAHSLDLRLLLDLVALGTIADLVPMTGENRILVTAGLERLNTTRRPGLIALRNAARITQSIGVYEVGFQLGPRLNAAGRLENAERALHLLWARDLDEATPIASELDAQNRERQRIERNIFEEVSGHVRAHFNPDKDFVIVEGQLLWHIGVVGIVASRVLREFYRPTLILGGEGDEWRGSGRSVEGFDLAAALRDCDDLLIRHGGHAMAAGVSMDPKKIDLLRDRLNELARRALTPPQLRPSLRLDGEVSLPDLTLERLAELDRLGPFGQQNPPVQLVVRNLRHHRPPQKMGKQSQHLKLWVTDGRAAREAIWWNGAGRPTVAGPFDLAFAPRINQCNCQTLVQLKVLDLKSAAQ